MTAPDNGWSEWSKHVLKELERLSKCYESLDTRFDKLFTEFHVFKTVMQVKAGLLGLLAGAIPVAIAIIVKYL